MVATAEIKRFDAATPARTRSDKPFWEEFHATFDKRHRKACTKAIRYRDTSKSLALQPPTRAYFEGTPTDNYPKLQFLNLEILHDDRIL